MKLRNAVVIGLGHFGIHLSTELEALGVEVLAIDKNQDRVEMLRDRVSHGVVLDSTDSKALGQLDLLDYDAVIVAIGENFEGALLTVAHLQELKVKRIISRVVSNTHERILRQMNINELVLPEKAAAGQLASCLNVKGLVEAIQITNEYSVVQASPPAWVVGKNLQELDLRKNYDINVVTLVKNYSTERNSSLSLGDKAELEVVPSLRPDTTIEADHNIIIFGSQKAIQKFLDDE